jgi:hypothetical protein
MQYIVEENLSNFNFWSGGADRAKLFTLEQLDEIEEHLCEIFGDEIPTDTQINDLFWFDVDVVAGLIGVRLDEDENVIEDLEEWAGDIIAKYDETRHAIYFDDFWLDASICGEPDWKSKGEVIEAFDDYVSDNWLDHAHDVLDEKFPDANDEIKDEFACEYWQNADTDEKNVADFEEYLKSQED